MNSYPPQHGNAGTGVRNPDQDACSPVDPSSSIPPGYKQAPEYYNLTAMDGPHMNKSQDSGIYVGEKKMAFESSVPALNTQADEICESGFSYLFRDSSIPPELVEMYFLANHGRMARYSQYLAKSKGRTMAVVLFRCAQLVLRARMGRKDNDIRISGYVVIQQPELAESLDVTGEELEKVLSELTHLGVLSHWMADQGGKVIIQGWYTFPEEHNFFPVPGELKIK
jgi:hypothetical protein